MSRLAVVYNNMKMRCYNPNSESYKWYGAKGITVCDEWIFPKGTRKGFNAFKSWALSNGYEDGLSLDRIDCGKGYSPENCRWVTMKEQENNRSNNRYITYKGKTQSLSKWCDELGLNYYRTKARINDHHWTVKRAFETKGDNRERLITYKGKSQSIKEWAKELGCSPAVISARLNCYHWSIERTLNEKVAKIGRKA